MRCITQILDVPRYRVYDEASEVLYHAARYVRDELCRLPVRGVPFENNYPAVNQLIALSIEALKENRREKYF